MKSFEFVLEFLERFTVNELSCELVNCLFINSVLISTFKIFTRAFYNLKNTISC